MWDMMTFWPLLNKHAKAAAGHKEKLTAPRWWAVVSLMLASMQLECCTLTLLVSFFHTVPRIQLNTSSRHPHYHAIFHPVAAFPQDAHSYINTTSSKFTVPNCNKAPPNLARQSSMSTTLVVLPHLPKLQQFANETSIGWFGLPSFCEKLEFAVKNLKSTTLFYVLPCHIWPKMTTLDLIYAT